MPSSPPPKDAWIKSIPRKIPGFSELQMHEPAMPPQVALTTLRVKRPLPADHPAIGVVMATLTWDPSQRIDAAKAAALTGMTTAWTAPMGIVTPTGHIEHLPTLESPEKVSKPRDSVTQEVSEPRSVGEPGKGKQRWQCQTCLQTFTLKKV